MYKLNNTLLNNQCAKEEVRREIKKYFKTNKSENTTYQNFWEAAKSILRRMFIATNTYIKQLERSLLKNLTFHLKDLEKKEQIQPYVRRRKQ